MEASAFGCSVQLRDRSQLLVAHVEPLGVRSFVGSTPLKDRRAACRQAARFLRSRSRTRSRQRAVAVTRRSRLESKRGRASMRRSLLGRGEIDARSRRERFGFLGAQLAEERDDILLTRLAKTARYSTSALRSWGSRSSSRLSGRRGTCRSITALPGKSQKGTRSVSPGARASSAASNTACHGSSPVDVNAEPGAEESSSACAAARAGRPPAPGVAACPG
jgi:hypothetical protein